MNPFSLSSCRRSLEAMGARWLVGLALAGPVAGQTINPTADAFVQNGVSNGVNFGKAKVMPVQSSASPDNNRYANLKFKVSTAPSSLGSAKLRVYSALSNGSTAVPMNVYPVADTNWSETAIKWTNKPAVGLPAIDGASVASATGAYKEYDVTSYVRSERAAGRTIISLALSNPSPSTVWVNVNARENSANKPQLVFKVNTAPTLSAIANQTMEEDTARSVPFVVGDVDRDPSNVVVTATSSNPALIPIGSPNLVIMGPGANRTLQILPVANQSGTARITLTANDGATANNTASGFFDVTVTAVNDRPTLDNIGMLTIAEDAPTQSVSLSGITSGAADEPQLLTVTATSSNPSFIPNPTVNYASPNTSGTLALAPVPNAYGSAEITVTVNDGAAANNTIQRIFTVTVTQVNDPPVIVSIPNQTTPEDSALTVEFTVSDIDTPLSNVSVTGLSSVPGLVPSGNFSFSGSGAARTVVITPALDQSGAAFIVLTANDGAAAYNTSSRSFTLTVNPVNDRPTLDAINNVTVDEDSGPQAVNLSGITSGAVNESQVLMVSASSSDPSIIPHPVIAHTSPSATGTLTLAPAPNAYGSATITVTVNDGQPVNNSVNRMFDVAVTAVNDPPTLAPINNVSVAADSPEQTILLTGITTGAANEPQTLNLTASSSDPSIIPDPVIAHTSPSASGTLTFTPAPGASGTATITVTVNDGGDVNNVITPQFTVSVNLQRLGRWRFDTADLTGDQGQAPRSGLALPGLAPSWNLKAADLRVGYPFLTYNEVEAGGSPNINVRNGTVRFWYNPSWDGQWLKAHHGQKARYTALETNEHGHYFDNYCGDNFVVFSSDELFAWVYLHPSNPPQEIMLEWKNANSWEHRAYWGANLIQRGTDGSPSRRRVGDLPPTGQWVRLHVPATNVGFNTPDPAGTVIKGMSFLIVDGQAKWDEFGKRDIPLAHDYDCGDVVWYDDDFAWPCNFPYPCCGTNAVTPWTGGEIHAGVPGNNYWPPGVGTGLWYPRLLEVGRNTGGADTQLWGLDLANDGSYIAFSGQNNSGGAVYLRAGINWTANQWHQVALTYSPTISFLYIDGELAAQGSGDAFYPDAATRSQSGFRVGWRDMGGNSFLTIARGQFEELETWNYPLDPVTIARDFASFNLANGSPDDTDYDGRTDLEETHVDGTNPNDPASVIPVRLGHWRFNTSQFLGEQGQEPISEGASLTPSWSGNAALISVQAGTGLQYHDVEPSGAPNINCRSGTVRLWFRPNWSSTGLYGGTGPQQDAILVEVGCASLNLDSWQWGLDGSGNHTTLKTRLNGVWTTLLDATHLYAADRWYELALTYGPAGTAFYVNGELKGTGSGVTGVPAASTRAGRFFLGMDCAGQQNVLGALDELETFNYPLTPAHIAADHQRFGGMDANHNGLSDYLEDVVLPAPVPFTGKPVTITGAFEAEQFDKGGPGVGYSSGVDHHTTDYRVTRLDIQPCEDQGGGYCVSRFRAGDWMRYTFDVRRAGLYTIEARVSSVMANHIGGFWQMQILDANGNLTLFMTTRQTGFGGWHSVAWENVLLPAGISSLKIIGQTDGGDGYVGRFNYFSIYPTVSDNVFSNYHVEVDSYGEWIPDTGTNFADAYTNSLTLQRAIFDVETNGGGTVHLPAGTFYLAQQWPTNVTGSDYERVGVSGRHTHAVRIRGSGIRISGAPGGQTVLKAHNRAVCVFNLGAVLFVGDSGSYSNASLTHITIENIVFSGSPHTRVDGRHESGWLRNAGGIHGSTSFIYVPGDWYPNRNIIIQNCEFRNTTVPIILADVEDILIRSNRFLFYTDAPGSRDGDPPDTPDFPDGVTYDGNYHDGVIARSWVGVFSGLARFGVRNAVVTDNYFDGNTRATSGDPEEALIGTDGVVWFGNGGNWFVARNTIKRYNIEAVHFQGGPGAVVGNSYETSPYYGGPSALTLTISGWNGLSDEWTGWGGSVHAADFAYSFIGNVVQGGQFGVLAQTMNDCFLPYSLNACGNAVRIDTPAPVNPYGNWGALASLLNCRELNAAGNTLNRGPTGGYGILLNGGTVTADVLKNDFRMADQGSLVFDGAPGILQRAALVKNALSRGNSAHLKLNYDDSDAFHLIKNLYLDVNGVDLMQPTLDPPFAPVHVQY